MWTESNIAATRTRRRAIKGTVAFVPTMGALHAGHVSLIHRARQIADHVIVSIFVNPTQFGPSEDFTKYPRPIERDLDLCREAGAVGVFNPTPAEIYPADRLPCDVVVSQLATILEGAARPGHFAGVCRVVLKLFNIVEPDVACFGMKDYQQLRVIQSMVHDLDLDVRIEPCPTLREPDSLAMSSRNVYLAPEQRKQAVGLFKALSEAKLLVTQSDETDPRAIESAMRQIIGAHHIEVSYAEVRHALSLAPLDSLAPGVTPGTIGPVVALVAGKLGGVRLIDNMVLTH